MMIKTKAFVYLVVSLVLSAMFACEAPDAPKENESEPAPVDSVRYIDSMNALNISKILDTAHIPNGLDEAAHYLANILPTINKYDFFFEGLRFSSNDKDSFLYVPFIPIPRNILNGTRCGLVINKNRRTDKVTSFYLSYKQEFLNLTPPDTPFRKTTYTDVSFKPFSITLRLFLADRMKFGFELPQSPILQMYPQKEEQGRVLKSLESIVRMSSFDRYKPLDTLKKQLEAIGGDTYKYFTFLSVPVDIDRDGEIDDAELLQTVVLKDAVKANNVLWCTNCPAIDDDANKTGTILPTVTVTNYIRTVYVGGRGGISSSSGALPSTINSGGLPDEYWQRAATGGPDFQHMKPNVDCGMMMFKEMKLQSPGTSLYKGAILGCDRDDPKTGKSRIHIGADIHAPLGTLITTLPVKDPYVLAIHTVDDNDFGKYAIVEGMDYMNPTQKIVILIAHLDVIYAKPGRYDPGDILGKVGSTGTATDDKPHAHIQVGISKDEVGLGLQKRFQNAGLLPKKNKEATQIYGAMTCTQKTAMLKEYAKKQELPEDFYDPLTHLPYQFNLETGECSNCQKDCK